MKVLQKQWPNNGVNNVSKQEEKCLLIDPNSGWRYGFPKPIFMKDIPPTTKWWLENGFPRNEMDEKGQPYYVRYIGDLELLEEALNTTWPDREEEQ